MKYALAKFRIYLLDSKSFVVYIDHASLRTATKSPHSSERMARWLAYFAEYNLTVEYKPGKGNILADALSRRPANFGLTATAEHGPRAMNALTDELSRHPDRVVETTDLRHMVQIHWDIYDHIRTTYSNDPVPLGSAPSD